VKWLLVMVVFLAGCMATVEALLYAVGSHGVLQTSVTLGFCGGTTLLCGLVIEEAKA